MTNSILFFLILFATLGCTKEENNPLQISYGERATISVGDKIFVGSEFSLELDSLADRRCASTTCETCFPNTAFLKFQINSTVPELFEANYPGCYVIGEDQMEQFVYENGNISFILEIYRVYPEKDQETKKKVDFKIIEN